MSEYPQATQDTLSTEPVHKELGVEGTGYKINHIEADSHSRFVVVTLPGFGGSASAEYRNLTEGNSERPHGLAVSYLHEFDPETLITGLVEEIGKLASNGPVEIVLHACSYGASILPPLIAKLKDMKNVHIQAILARSPLFDRTCFSDGLQTRDARGLTQLFSFGRREQERREKRLAPPDEAKADELLAVLPPTMDQDYVQTLRDKGIHHSTILFSDDVVISNNRVTELLGGHGGKPELLESNEGYLMGHHPIDVEGMREYEREWVAGHMSTT